MQQARIWATIKIDKTGNYLSLPVILVLRNNNLTVLEPLLSYFTSFYQIRSFSWMEKLCQILGLLLDYIEENRNTETKPYEIFESFIHAVYHGTYSRDGRDPTKLGWFPTNTKTANQKLRMLNEFSDWMVNNGYAEQCLNPWTHATASEERLNWISWYRKNGHSFLGHLGASENVSAGMSQARKIKLRRQSTSNIQPAKAFPANFETALLREGFVRPGKQDEKDILKKYDWRGICIAMLMLYGARRVSEPFHLWTGDVIENPTRPNEALVRIYHPQDGQAPDDKKINGRRVANREAYLKAFFPNYLPRNKSTGNYHAGWKGRVFADDTARYIQVYWLPSDMASAFLWAYHNYMLVRARNGFGSSRHPFAFVSEHSKTKGEPYSIKAFNQAWERALRKIGLPNAKIHGTSPHGGRHATGHRAVRAKIADKDIREMFAHRSLESQEVYTVPGIDAVTKQMDAATLRMRFAAKLAEQGLAAEPPPADWKDIWGTKV